MPKPRTSGPQQKDSSICKGGGGSSVSSVYLLPSVDERREEAQEINNLEIQSLCPMPQAAGLALKGKQGVWGRCLGLFSVRRRGG
jgi:hypothetical protein